MIRLKDIAKACDVSIATVSRALNGVTADSHGRAERIRQVAAEMGYYPNAAAKTLKTNRSGNIGILYEDRMDHEYFSSLIDALREEAAVRSLDLTLLSRDVSPSVGSYYEHARRRNLDGVVVVQADFHSTEVIRLAMSSLPTVVIDHDYEGCDCVLSDNHRSMEQILEAAYRMGHRRIAFLHGEDSTVTRSRKAGFYKGCAELGLRAPAEYLQESGYHNPAACAQSVMKLLESDAPPSCILCPDDYSCIGALGMLEAKGLRVPENVSLIGYDGIRLSQMIRPRLTTYSQDTEAIARETMIRLTDAVERPEQHVPRRIPVSGHLVQGETLGQVGS